ncbi:hypothetical protein TNIN_223261 [Trichonephila inaurata madagascariensis]|uniref:Uncharacterized protein n=1 Tax=Trichonephila inaurata madagascariensis TaxID=2747483 RepID=A0A8X7C1P5_9ARAC|nr:hypothetical protein TNIN_223261 [Trichonephila inaurata madagascariensis]
MCQGMEIKVQLAPVEQRKVWIPKRKCETSTKYGELKSTKMILVVQSYSVHKICGALGLQSEFDPLIEPSFFINKRQNKRKSREFVPLVQSQTIFKICQGLGIQAILASPPEI